MLYICFAAGLVILGSGVYFAYKKRYNTQEWISAITFAALLAVFIMILPTPWKNSDGSPIGWLYNLISALQYSLKSLSGRQGLEQLNYLKDSGVFGYIYVFVNYIIYLIIPILGTGLIISFVGDTLAKIRYFLPVFGNIVVFSELNESSYLIAKGLRDSDKRYKIVFCGTKKTNVKLLEKARSIRAVNLYKRCEEMRLKSGHDRYEFYLVSENEDKNTQTARALISKYGGIKDKSIYIKAFVNKGPETELLERVVYSIYHPDPNNTGYIEQNINLSFIDKTELFCNNLVYEHPLYETADDGKNVSVMIVGCGETGMTMLKTVLWSGQIYGHRLKVRVYDKNADRCRAVFEKKCPELDKAHGYDVKFYSVDAETSDFERLITSNGQAESATVAYVFTGDEDFNINTSVFLYGIFRKNRDFGKTPPIYTWTRSGEKLANFSSHNKEYLEKRNIVLTGNIESIYEKKMIFLTELERLALGAHLCYNCALGENENTDRYKQARQSFVNTEYNRRSSMAAAIHFRTKLYIFNMWLKENMPDSKEDLRDIFERTVGDKNSEIAVILAENEHERWNAFMRSEGYSSTDTETAQKYGRDTKKDRDDYSKLHLCITDWDSLDEAENKFNAFGYAKEKKDFKKSDFDICSNIFKIEDYAEKMKEVSFYV